MWLYVFFVHLKTTPSINFGVILKCFVNLKGCTIVVVSQSPSQDMIKDTMDIEKILNC